MRHVTKEGTSCKQWTDDVVANTVYYFNVLELIALLESDLDSQLELKKAADDLGSILCTL